MLIVVSILLAFAIDAWWDGRGLQRQEQDLLVGLQAEFQRNRELLAGNRAQHARHRDATVAFLARSTPAGDPRPEPIDDQVLIDLLSWATYDPLMGTLGSAVQSGQLGLISNQELRIELATWRDLVEDLNEAERVEQDLVTRLAEGAYLYVPFRSVVHRLGNELVERTSTAEADWVGLLRSLEMENLATNRLAEEIFLLGDLRNVETALERILVLLDQEL